MTGHLIVNPRGGSGNGTDDLVEAAAARGVETHVLKDGDDLAELARRAAADGATAVGMAGGDGSLAPVAEACLERDVPFVCIPFGTRNHFARDLGLDRDDPLAALDAFAGGSERRVDVGRANDRLFLNNVSLGVYARLVHRREHHRRRSEALARLRALLALARNPRPIGITVDGEPVKARVVLVASNAYTLQPFSLGERDRLDEGCLHLYVPAGLVRRHWRDRTAERFELGALGPLRAAVDGEPDVLEPPISFRVEPRALRVLVPAAAGPEA
jgi:diacylglycerol kinase family enzyme